jgi:predicted RNase H-like nuclease (RuvC/YqgF family)
MQGQENNININYVVKEYQEKVSNLTNENVVMNAYVKQLEAELARVKTELEECRTELDKSNK